MTFNLCLVYKDDFFLCNLGNYLWHFNVVHVRFSRGNLNVVASRIVVLITVVCRFGRLLNYIKIKEVRTVIIVA